MNALFTWAHDCADQRRIKESRHGRGNHGAARRAGLLPRVVSSISVITVVWATPSWSAI